MAGWVCATHATKIAITVPLEIVIADQPAREADQDRPEGCEPRPVRHVQMAQVAVSRQMFQEILSLIARLRAPPAPA
jgi:hypothetical protein